jgi:TRAP-type C4-dicarboxylate transport system substrate-binding protein
MGKRKTACLLFLFFFITIVPLCGITIKLGSLAPTDSPWDKLLKQLAADWEKASSGRVTIKIYAGGVVGDEAVMLRKIRLGQLHAAAITGVGMNQIHQGVLALSIPMLITNDDELSYALENLGPYFEGALEKKSFKVIMWTFAGWTHIFSKQPARTPEDLKKQKLWVWEGSSKELQIWKEAGFHPVPLALPDIMTSLQSGMVDSFFTTPLSAAAYQWFGIASNMNEMNWAPMIAGIIIASSTWEKIPKDLQPTFIDIAHKAGIRITEETKKADAEAMRIMKKYGLTSYPPAKDSESEWKKIIDKYFDKYIDSEIGRESYIKVKNLLSDYRKNAKAK